MTLMLLQTSAEAQTTEELLDIIRRQAAEIEALKSRVDALEQRRSGEAEGAAAPAAAAEAQGSPQEPDYEVAWKGAPQITSADGAFSFKPRGRIHADAWTVSSRDGGVDYASGAELRRARLGADGVLYRDFIYSIEVDFAGRSVGLEDAIVGYRGWEDTALTLGYHKSPITLEDQTSDNYVTFMERASFATTFAPGRGVGVSARFSGERWMTMAGVFGESENDTRDGRVDEDWVVAGRLTGAPVLTPDAAIHLGMSAYHLEAASDQPQFRLDAQPEFHLGQPLVDTAVLDVSKADFIGLETAAVMGPFHAAAEWGSQWASLRNAGTGRFDGFYAQIGWFLTGERRPYSASSGTFGRVQPLTPLNQGGPGAIEFALRYGELDLSDAAVPGGLMNSWTLGLNWYPNAYTRLMFNWVRFDIEDSGRALPFGRTDHEGDAFGVRAQIDW